MRRHAYTLAATLSLCLAACGGDDSGTDPGGGTGTLLVVGEADFDGVADFSVSVQRAGLPVTDAVVEVDHPGGTAVLFYQGGADYGGTVAWGGVFRLRVSAGADHLHGSISAPEPAGLTSPDPSQLLDPHTAEGGLVHVRWNGAAADSVRVRTGDFEHTGADEGHVAVPAFHFVEDVQEIEVRRRNEVPLAGGVPGSKLTATAETRVDIHVRNPF